MVTRTYIKPYVIPDMPDLSLIEEPHIYPYPEGLLPADREIKNWILLDVYWNIDNDCRTNFSRYYFSYISAEREIILSDKRQFTGYALMESRWDTTIKTYGDPIEIWGIHKWAYKGMFSSQKRNGLALKMLLLHWERLKDQDKELNWHRRFHNVSFWRKKENLLNNQMREVARWVWF